MRRLRFLLLLLLLVPPMAIVLPCCADAETESCCPVERDCQLPDAACRDTQPVLTLTPTVTPVTGALVVAATPQRPNAGAGSLQRSARTGRRALPPSARFTPLRN
jgi:hypothetical protein